MRFIEPYIDYSDPNLIDTTICGKVVKNNQTFLISCIDLNMTNWVEKFNNETFPYSRTYLIFPGTSKVYETFIKVFSNDFR